MEAPSDLKKIREGILQTKKEETKLPELRITYVVYFIDSDPDTGFVSQMKPIVYTEYQWCAEEIAEWFNQKGDDPNRVYKSTTVL